MVAPETIRSFENSMVLLVAEILFKYFYIFLVIQGSYGLFYSYWVGI